MIDYLKKNILDSRVEPYARWLVKRSRGIKIPFDLVKNEIYDRQAFELIKQVLSVKSNCVDVGCNEGVFLREFLRYAPQGRHFAFEPNPDFANQLVDKFPTVQVFPCALSNSTGESAFYVIPEAPALSGLHRREFIHPEKVRRPITVRTERLDDLLPRQMKIDLIKIDVEGAEGLVILGAFETITRHQPYIILEHGSESSMAFGLSSGDVYDLVVNQCNLRLSTLRGYLYGKPNLTKNQFEAGREWYFLAHPLNCMIEN